MRLWTLVLASAVVWLVTPVAALADDPAPAAAAVGFDADEADAPAAQETPEAAVDATAPASADAAPAPAAEAAAAPAPAADSAASWDDFEDKGFDPAQAAPSDAQPAAPKARLHAKAAAIPLGPMAVDSKGVQGRIHTVSKGDTLWDISEAYLGTPWVWPSVWDENQEIANPHRINPGDKIWITANEMRRVTDAEAEQMISNANEVADTDEMEFDEGEPLAEEPMPAAAEEEPVLAAAPIDPGPAIGESLFKLPRDPDTNFASEDDMEDAAQVVDSPVIRKFLTQGDTVYMNLGEGEVSVGDEFSVFHDIDKIRDIETGAVLGYHYDALGWIEVTRVEGESSTGVIRGAHGDIARGDHLLPRKLAPREITLRLSSDDIEGQIVFTPGFRQMMGSTDSVYLNIGSIQGLEIGTQMEVYVPGTVMKGAKMPDTVYARMVVVSVEPETSVAYVTQTNQELEVGADVRTFAPDKFAVR